MRNVAWTAPELARLLRARRSGERWKARCPAHADREPSLLIWNADGRAAFWCAAGCDWSDVAAELRARGAVIADRRGSARIDADRRGMASRKIPQNRNVPDLDARRIGWARDIWRAASRARGTAAEYYLALRGLALPADVDGRVVRFHPACPRGRERVPALVVGLTSPDSDEIVGVSRTYLTRDFKRDGERMVLGRMGIARVSAAPGRRLYVAEGLETALALWLGGYRPVWALMCAGKLERCPVIDGVDELVACLDNDVSRTGWRAGQRLCSNWREAAPERVVKLWMPDVVGADWADVLRA